MVCRFIRLCFTLCVVSTLWMPATALANTMRPASQAPAKALDACPGLRVSGRHFVDTDGRTVLLRGINVAGNSKVPPFTPIQRGEQLDPLVELGFNSIRLLFTWEAYEPRRGDYQPAYLDYIRRVAEWAAERCLYTIVDIHQDAFSRYQMKGCGEGFPAWTVPSTITRQIPDNGPNCRWWGLEMVFNMDMHRSWQAFYADFNGVRSRFLAMFRRLAAELSDLPTVIGYDLLNEPWGDERREIMPLYTDAIAAVREVAPDAIAFLTPHVLVGSGIRSELPTPPFGNAVYAPHYYDATVVGLHRWWGTKPDFAFRHMSEHAATYGAPLFVGEFGAPVSAENIQAYLNALYDNLNRHLASGTQWNYTPGWTPAEKDGWNDEDFSIVDDHGDFRANVRPRPYPQQIAGTPSAFQTRWSADDDRLAEVSLRWQHHAVDGVTRIFAPRQLFGPTGPEISHDASSTCTYEESERFLHCATDMPGQHHVALRSRDE